SAMKTVNSYLRRAVCDGEDIEARIKMAEASVLAGMAFNQSYLGLAHAIGSAISGHANVSHGVTIGLLLSIVLEFNLSLKVDKCAQIGKLLIDDNQNRTIRETAELAIEKVKLLRDEIGLPQTLSSVGVREDQFKEIATDSIKSTMWNFNPRKAMTEDI